VNQVIEDLETLWEVPLEPRGVLFVAHGCAHQGSDFWPASDRCQHCLGLPEELLVRGTALGRGYALIAVSSFDREGRCWDNTVVSRSDDLQVGGGRQQYTSCPACAEPAGTPRLHAAEAVAVASSSACLWQCASVWVATGSTCLGSSTSAPAPARQHQCAGWA
jgi:hypothetical protein